MATKRTPKQIITGLKKAAESMKLKKSAKLADALIAAMAVGNLKMGTVGGMAVTGAERKAAGGNEGVAQAAQKIQKDTRTKEQKIHEAFAAMLEAEVAKKSAEKARAEKFEIEKEAAKRLDEVLGRVKKEDTRTDLEKKIEELTKKHYEKLEKIDKENQEALLHKQAAAIVKRNLIEAKIARKQRDIKYGYGEKSAGYGLIAKMNEYLENKRFKKMNEADKKRMEDLKEGLSSRLDNVKDAINSLEDDVTDAMFGPMKGMYVWTKKLSLGFAKYSASYAKERVLNLKERVMRHFDTKRLLKEMVKQRHETGKLGIIMKSQFFVGTLFNTINSLLGSLASGFMQMLKWAPVIAGVGLLVKKLWEKILTDSNKEILKDNKDAIVDLSAELKSNRQETKDAIRELIEFEKKKAAGKLGFFEAIKGTYGRSSAGNISSKMNDQRVVMEKLVAKLAEINVVKEYEKKGIQYQAPRDKMEKVQRDKEMGVEIARLRKDFGLEGTTADLKKAYDKLQGAIEKLAEVTEKSGAKNVVTTTSVNSGGSGNGGNLEDAQTHREMSSIPAFAQ